MEVRPTAQSGQMHLAAKLEKGHLAAKLHCEPQKDTLCTPVIEHAHLPQLPLLMRCSAMQLVQYSRCPHGRASTLRLLVLHTVHSTCRRALLQAEQYQQAL